MRNPSSILALGVAAALFAALLSAHASAKDEKAHPMRVAILPIVNGSSDVGAPKIMGDIFRERFKEIPADRATFLEPDDTERLLSNRNELGRAYAINDRWSKSGQIDTTAALGLDSLLSANAILLVKISEWENNRVTVIGRGQSSATVGLQFALFDLHTLKRTWMKEPREQRFAQEIDPSSNVGYDGTGYIQSHGATDPPRYQDVASDLVRSAFKNFPQK